MDKNTLVTAIFEGIESWRSSDPNIGSYFLLFEEDLLQGTHFCDLFVYLVGNFVIFGFLRIFFFFSGLRDEIDDFLGDDPRLEVSSLQALLQHLRPLVNHPITLCVEGDIYQTDAEDTGILIFYDLVSEAKTASQVNTVNSHNLSSLQTALDFCETNPPPPISCESKPPSPTGLSQITAVSSISESTSPQNFTPLTLSEVSSSHWQTIDFNDIFGNASITSQATDYPSVNTSTTTVTYTTAGCSLLGGNVVSSTNTRESGVPLYSPISDVTCSPPGEVFLGAAVSTTHDACGYGGGQHTKNLSYLKHMSEETETLDATNDLGLSELRELMKMTPDEVSQEFDNLHTAVTKMYSAGQKRLKRLKRKPIEVISKKEKEVLISLYHENFSRKKHDSMLETLQRNIRASEIIRLFSTRLQTFMLQPFRFFVEKV